MPYINKDTQYTPLSRLLRGYGSHVALAEAMGISRQTAAARLENPEMLTIRELSLCRRKLHIPAEDILRAIHL